MIISITSLVILAPISWEPLFPLLQLILIHLLGPGNLQLRVLMTSLRKKLLLVRWLCLFLALALVHLNCTKKLSFPSGCQPKTDYWATLSGLFEAWPTTLIVKDIMVHRRILYAFWGVALMSHRWLGFYGRSGKFWCSLAMPPITMSIETLFHLPHFHARKASLRNKDVNPFHWCIIELNIGGFAKGNPRLAGFGGIFRSDHGKWIMQLHGENGVGNIFGGWG